MSSVKSPKNEFHRLPTSVVPEHYSLQLQPNLVSFEFIGQETIEVQIKETSSSILLNAVDLSINSADWPPLEPSKGSLKISFTGVLNDKLKGFYRSKYVGSCGEDKFNAVTHFEPTSARACFPCWDEPAIRATFDVTLIVPRYKTALSNMPIKKETILSSSLMEYQFERTPKMSTYLVAFVVGAFEFVEGQTSDGTLCRVYTPMGKKKQGRFALDVAVRVLPYYKRYFGVPYTLPKVDLIAIADFAIGAMENWGLVTYRETCLLVDEQETSALNRQWVALVVGHELAHQWFGNLVALEWWTHLWLKEGYASFVEFLCVNELFPEFDIWTQFVTDIRIPALELDALENSHPIEVPVGHPSEIGEIFDTISYRKGASIIRMLHDYLGIDAFKQGMHLYLTRFQYRNAATEDLWQALADSSKKPVDEVMSTWTKQMGFPLISVSSEQQGNNRVISMIQEKFSASPRDTATENYHWLVPLTFSSSENPNKAVQGILMKEKSATFTISNVDENQWVKVNPGAVGFYRVSYSSEMLAQLIPAIKSKSLPALDRLNIVDDIFALVRAGKTSTAELLQLLEAFVNEDNYSVWTSIDNIIEKLALLFDNVDSLENLKAYGRRLYSRVETIVGWDSKENESHSDALLRSLVLSRMIAFDNKKTIQKGKARFESIRGVTNNIPADLRDVVYKAALCQAEEATFKSLLEMYKKADIQEEKERIACAMGSVKDSNILKQILEFAISDQVRNQDSVYVMIPTSKTKLGRDLLWTFMKDRVQLIRERYLGGNMASRLIKSALENFASSAKATEIEKFFAENPLPGTERNVQQACECIRLNEAWLARDYPQTKTLLASIKSSNS
ncbi:unnamed protein product [Allacma fusca]|uniref:Aminopeptidase n=1 Tax=Allacma fusca TaxID=39272 RepID=A0A8J2LJX8_9HEXA|nr:unnamed protein product [Allacma fusca]